MPSTSPPARPRLRRVNAPSPPDTTVVALPEPDVVRVDWRQVSSYVAQSDVGPFVALARALEDEFLPRTAYEAVLVENLATLTWEAHAYRIAKKAVFNTLRAKALETLLHGCIHRGHGSTIHEIERIERYIPQAAAQHAQGIQIAVDWVNSMLTDGGRSIHEVDGLMFAENIGTVTALEKLIVANEQLRENALAELIRRQAHRHSAEA